MPGKVSFHLGLASVIHPNHLLLSLFLLPILAHCFARSSSRKSNQQRGCSRKTPAVPLSEQLSSPTVLEGLPPFAGPSLTDDHGTIADLLLGDSPFTVSTCLVWPLQARHLILTCLSSMFNCFLLCLPFTVAGVPLSLAIATNQCSVWTATMVSLSVSSLVTSHNLTIVQSCVC